QGNHSSDSPVLSADGRFVAFASDASNLVAGDTNAAADVFVHDRCVSNGSPVAGCSPSTERVSVASDGTQGNFYSSGAAISALGRFVAFVSGSTNLVAGDTNGWADVFVHDRLTNTTERVSVASDATQGDGQSGGPEASISGDGRFVVFDSFASNLVPGDTNSCGNLGLYARAPGTCPDIFVHDR